MLIAISTLIAFYPALQNGFVNWDDDKNILENPFYRGLHWTNIRWMFTTFHMGPYQPLSWLTLGLDYALWGLNPFGYHLTSLVLHGATAVAFFFLTRELLSIAVGGSEKESAVVWAGVVSALFFALHPLRVESVVWVTERRDVLSGLFYTLTLLVYVHAWRAEKLRGGWYWAALALYLCAILAKSITVTLPVVLVLLDIYPLRRLGGNNGWWSESARAVYREKIPFLLLSVVASAVAFIAIRQIQNLASLEQLGLLERLAISAYGLWFYFWKSVVPLKLSPLYELPTELQVSSPAFVLSYAFVIGALALGLALRRRLPGVGIAALAYVVTLLPVLGIFQNGPQLVAERYSYLACMSLAVLVGAGFFYWLVSIPSHQPQRLIAGAVVAGTILTLGFLTWEQTKIWRDTRTLWEYVLVVAPTASLAHYNLGRTVETEGDPERAMELYARAVTLNPRQAEAYHNLARLLARKGRSEEAMNYYRRALEVKPDDADTHNNLGLLLALRGEANEGLMELQSAVRIDPNHARAYFNMGRLFARQGDYEKAIGNFQQALKLQPNEVEVHVALGNVFALQGETEAATRQFEQAVKLNPESVDAHVAFARLLASQMRNDDAERHYQQALQLLKVKSAALADRAAPPVR